MFEIRYSAGYGVDLAASRVELENLKNAIQDLIKGDLSELSFDADEKIDPKPWDSVGQTLKIHRGGEAVRVSISNNSTLVVKGSDENLDNFVFRRDCTKRRARAF